MNLLELGEIEADSRPTSILLDILVDFLAHDLIERMSLLLFYDLVLEQRGHRLSVGYTSLETALGAANGLRGVHSSE